MNESRVGVVVVAVPVLHVLSTSMFLWAYALGFGGNLLAFVGPSDIFSISISDMIRVYLTSLVVPFLMGINKYLPGYVPPTLPPIKGDDGTRAKRLTVAVFGSLVAIILITEFYIVWSGRPFDFFLVNIAVILALSPVVSNLSHKISLSNIGRDLSYIGTLFFVSALFLGLDAGSTDRHRRYERFPDDMARCGAYGVIRRIDTYYLAVLPSTRKALIDADCRVRFRFHLTKVEP